MATDMRTEEKAGALAIPQAVQSAAREVVHQAFERLLRPTCG